MDRYIIEFPNKTSADTYANKLHTYNITYAKSNGYTIIDNEIVGKTNGVDNPTAQRTIKWDEPVSDGNGKFSVIDERANPKFINALDRLPNNYRIKIKKAQIGGV